MGKTSLATNMAFSIANTFEKKLNEDGTKSTIRGGVVGFFFIGDVFFTISN